MPPFGEMAPLVLVEGRWEASPDHQTTDSGASFEVAPGSVHLPHCLLGWPYQARRGGWAFAGVVGFATEWLRFWHKAQLREGVVLGFPWWKPIKYRFAQLPGAMCRECGNDPLIDHPGGFSLKMGSFP